MLGEWLSSGWSVVLVILGLGLVIFLHELGHFLMAKKNGVRVEVFSLGFGPAIFRFRRGETEYRVSWLPLGGYVKMAGETLMDERKGESWELTSKSPWQRFQIFVAGAVMNLVIAFPIAIAAYGVGMYENSNVVARPGMAETRGLLRPGDVIVEVDGRKIQSMDKFRIEMVRRTSGTRVPVSVLRDGEKVTLEVESLRSPFHQTEWIQMALGDRIVPDSPLWKAGARPGDDLVSIDGKPVLFRNQADEILRGSPGRKVKLGLRRPDPAFDDRELEVELELGRKEWWVVPDDDRIQEARVGLVVPGNPAYDALEPDDLVVRIGDRQIHSWADLKAAVEPSVNVPLEFTVDRAGKEVKVTIVPSYGQSGKGAIGIREKDGRTFAVVDPESPLGKAGVRAGDVIYSSADGRTGKITLQTSRIVGVRKPDPSPVSFEVVRGSNRILHRIGVQTEKREEADLAGAGFETDATGRMILHPSRPYRRRPFGDAMAAGLYEPYDVAILTFELLKKLVGLQESAKGLSGPLGIIQASYSFAQLSFGNFLWLLCLITVNLGIFNLLPIPILDGGHNLLLLIEVIRKKLGKPPPTPAFVAAFQWTGLIFVLALFVFVTFNDIERFIGRG